jgi:mitochondrial fission protein ELM1
MSEKTAWVLTEGMAGMVTQAVGLAEAVGLPFETKTITLRAPWCWLPARYWPKGVLGLDAASDPLMPPWPDLVISCGRKAIGPALTVKRCSGGRCFAVHIQNPHLPSRAFDLIVAATHDQLTGDNVIVTRGALHRVTKSRLEAARADYEEALARMPRPLTAVLVGGPNRVYRMTPPIATDLATKLAAFADATGGSLAVTPSRRTGADNVVALSAGLRETSAVIWDGEGENPYFGYLAQADQIIVTCDSVSMVSEACATGKPVYVFDLPGGGDKFRRFHQTLRENGITRRFTGIPEDWRYEPFDDTARVAAEIHQRMAGANRN